MSKQNEPLPRPVCAMIWLIGILLSWAIIGLLAKVAYSCFMLGWGLL